MRAERFSDSLGHTLIKTRGVMTFCTGIPGSPAHKVSDPDNLVGGICPECEQRLISGVSWSHQLQGINEAKSRGGKKGGGKRENSEWRNYATKLPAKGEL